MIRAANNWMCIREYQTYFIEEVICTIVTIDIFKLQITSILEKYESGTYISIESKAIHLIFKYIFDKTQVQKSVS